MRSSGLLRYRADRFPVLIMGLVTTAFVAQWFVHDRFSGPWFAISIVTSLQVASMAHNHNHLSMWRPAWLNVLTDYWLTFFYGLPKLSWLAIHNQSHHTHGNQPHLDCTSTHNVRDRNDLVGLLLYTPACTPGFWREHGRALARLYRQDRRGFAYHVSHILFLWGAIALFLVWDWQKAILYVLVPQTVGISSITTFNFCQHAHADAGSRYNVTRNFTSPILNFYLFNVGYHTSHHVKPTLHWSLARDHQARLDPHVDPRLQEPSFWRYFGRVIVLGTLFRRFRSEPVQDAAHA